VFSYPDLEKKEPNCTRDEVPFDHQEDMAGFGERSPGSHSGIAFDDGPNQVLSAHNRKLANGGEVREEFGVEILVKRLHEQASGFYSEGMFPIAVNPPKPWVIGK
jgi:hypothetical protein